MKRPHAYFVYGLLGVLGALTVLSFNQHLEAQPKPASRLSGNLEQRTVESLTAIETKVNKLLQSQGGRFAFLISEGELIRLDTQLGKIAIFNIVQGASWDTLEIPEKQIGPGNAFYERYVQFLDKTEFNTN